MGSSDEHEHLTHGIGMAKRSRAGKGRALALGGDDSPIGLPHRTSPQAAYIVRTERGQERARLRTQTYEDV